MIRSGSTLQYNIVRSLLENMKLGKGHGYFDANEYVVPERQLKQWANDKYYHVIKMHDLHPKAEEMTKSGLVKICYIYRDIRDVAVSANNIWSDKGEKLIESLDKAIKIYYDIKKIPNVPMQKYEDVVGNLPNAVKEIADFLNINPNEEVINVIVRDCSIESMKKISIKMIFIKKLLIFMRTITPTKLRPFLRKASGLRGYAYFDKNTLLHPGHISKNIGAIGVWKTALEKHEINIITTRYQSWFIEAGYPLEV